MSVNKEEHNMEQKQDVPGAQLLIEALQKEGVEIIFGYPGGAVLPIYDALFKQDKIKHVLVRHEQAAVHAAEAYARSTGKVGVILVTSGPGATNTVTGLQDALMDSVPLVCLCGQVPVPLLGTQAFQEADIKSITHAATKKNWLVKEPKDLTHIVHEAFYTALEGCPGPVLIDLPKNITAGPGVLSPSQEKKDVAKLKKEQEIDQEKIKRIVAMMRQARRPLFYTGGGLINSGNDACKALTQLVKETDFPITSTLMGFGAFPGEDQHYLGLVGMHGLYESNMAMHDCDVMIALGVRFDDRVIGRLDGFSPGSKKIQVDINPHQINKIVKVNEYCIGDVGLVIEAILKEWRRQEDEKQPIFDIASWWDQINKWRQVDCLAFEQEKNKDSVIKPQQAIKRIYEISRNMKKEPYVSTEVGQHQMWTAQFFRFSKPAHFLTSGGAGTMGYGLPAAVGAQIAHPNALVIDIAGEASMLMNVQELGTICQYGLKVKIFIINNHYMGMVRQWQELLHGSRYSQSYSAALPDFVKLAGSFHIKGMRVTHYGDLDKTIKEALDYDGPVVVDISVTQEENCFPMIPSGAAHNEMIFSAPDEEGEIDQSLV